MYGGMSRTTKLDIRIGNLNMKMRKLLSLNNTLRSGLRINGGHKGKVNNKVLLWLDHVDRIEIQFSDICHRYLSLLKLVRFIPICSSSLVVVFATSIFFYEGRSSRALYHLLEILVGKIKEKIEEYLDDPMIRTISFCGEGWMKDEITERITAQLTNPPNNTIEVESIRGKLFEKTGLKNLQHYITTQVKVQVPAEQNAEVSKCLFIFDDEWIEPELSIKNACKVKILVYKVDRQVRNLTREVKLLVESYSSLQVLSDEDGAVMVPGRFTTQKKLGTKLAQEVSSSIWEYLLDPTIGIIGLYGVGGVGKTTIIKQICTELASADIFDMIIWVSLSRTKMDKDNYIRLQNEIAMQLGIKLVGYENLQKQASRISEKLKIVGKCLFVLDDVWQTVSLVTIGIPYPLIAYDCKIVLTTRNRDICVKMAVDKQINLTPLSDQEAWDLFVSNSGDQVLYPEIKSIAKKIVYECGGLPITIITVCHAMKDEVSITAWNLALKDIQRSHRKIYGEGMDRLLDVLFFGYKHLMNDQIRVCFLCCAIFPEDHKFDSTELIRYWMAMDVIHNERGIVDSINDGLKILKELKDAKMLEIFMEGGMERLNMHDLFRDLAILITRVELDFFIKAGAGLRSFPITMNGKISLIRNSINSFHLRPHLLIKLSTLLLRDNPLDSIPYSFFSSTPNLQVLDMSYSGLNQLPLSLSELCKLRVLFLDFCTGLEKLPSLEKLKGLQFFSLRGTLIKELPHGIEGLVNLVSLNLSETVRLKHIKAGVISSLYNLEELQLQGSRLCKMESPEVANVFKEIRCLKQLGILTLSAVGFGDHLDMIVHLQQYNLKTFSVNAYGSTLDYTEDEEHN